MIVGPFKNKEQYLAVIKKAKSQGINWVSQKHAAKNNNYVDNLRALEITSYISLASLAHNPDTSPEEYLKEDMGYIVNCDFYYRDGDPPLFTANNNKFIPRLDSYVIIPKEKIGEYYKATKKKFSLIKWLFG